MSYVYISDLSPNLPMTTYEYARMKAFEAAGIDHETAKTRIYTERGSSGQPKVAAGPGDQPAPAPAPAPVATPVSTPAPASATATPWWRSGLGMAALGTAGVAAGYFLSRMVRSGSSKRSDSMTDITGDEVTGVLSRRNGSVKGHPHEKALRRLLDRMAHHGGRNMVVDSLSGRHGSDVRAEARAFLGELGLMGLLTGYDGKDDSVLDDPTLFGAVVRLSPDGEAERKS